MNAQTPLSELSFQLPSMSYVDAKWEEPDLYEQPVAKPHHNGLASWAARRLAAFRAWRQQKQALADLRNMTDRELMDIGLNRGDIYRVVNPTLNADLRMRGLAN